MLEKNVGRIDKTARIILGLILLVAGLFVTGGGLGQWILFFLAAIALVTAFLGFCPLNKLLGINTSQTGKS